MLPSIVLFGMLLISAYRDWKEKSVYLYLLMGTGIAGLVFHIIFQEHTIIDVLGGIAIGVLVLLFSLLSRGGIGSGDGLTLMVSGIFLGFEKNMELFITAICFSAVMALFLLVVRRKARSYRIPFLPFLLASYLMLLI